MKLSLIAILVIAGMGLTTAYAYEVEIPYENFQLTGCSDVDGIYTCQWKNLFDEIPTDAPTDIPEETVEEAIEEEIPIILEVTMTREEQDIQRMIDKIELDLQENPDAVPNADKQLLILLKRAQDECYFGIEQGAPIQQYALFAIPKGNLYIDDTDFSKYNMLGKLAKLIEACTAWDKYRVSHLGQQYSDINQAGLDATPFVPSAVLGENVTNTKEYMERFISEHDIIEEEEDAADFMCSMEGQQRGLCSEFFYGMNRGGYVDTTDNPILSKYLQYKAQPELAVGEPRYDVTENPKCYILHSFIVQNEISKENGDIMLEAAGCKI